MSLLVRNCRHEGQKKDLYIEAGKIETLGEVDPGRAESADRVLDAAGQLVFPALLNGHTHAAMTLFRGFGDDLPLQTWLEEKIWPAEKQLTSEAVYWGTRLACLEMIRCGTCFFNDMYWHPEATMRAVEDSGIRALVSGVFIDEFDPEKAEKFKQENKKLHERSREYSERIKFSLGPHAIYTVSPESLEWVAEYSREHNLPVHIHLAETQHEVQQCRQEHGTTPVKYLDDLDFFHSGVICAHGLWVEPEEIELLASSGVSISYNPISNLKLTSGDDFQYKSYREAGVKVCLGTDGAASNNNLNSWEEVKTAALLQKNRQRDATVLPAREALDLATVKAADIFGLESGRLEPGANADLILVDLEHPSLQPDLVPDSLLAYSLLPEAITTTICDGEVLMRDRKVKDDEKITREAKRLAGKLRT